MRTWLKFRKYKSVYNCYYFRLSNLEKLSISVDELIIIRIKLCMTGLFGCILLQCLNYHNLGKVQCDTITNVMVYLVVLIKALFTTTSTCSYGVSAGKILLIP